jgi:hypothetical protein
MAENIVLPIHLGHSEEEDNEQGAQAIARAVGVSRRTILRWKNAGAPIYLVGRKYQCRYDDLWNWIAANEKILYVKERRTRKIGKIKKAVN